MEREAAWIKALTFAALPGAARVEFERIRKMDGQTPVVGYTLRSVSESGDTIGDDRDYDLLKAAITPLERLSESIDTESFQLQLDLQTQQLKLV